MPKGSRMPRDLNSIAAAVVTDHVRSVREIAELLGYVVPATRRMRGANRETTCTPSHSTSTLTT